MVARLYQDFVGEQTSSARANTEEADDIERRLARARGKARADGFADGAASAEATFDRELRSCIDTVSQALTHLAADRQASDAASVDAIRRILVSTLTAFTPSLADAALPALVAETVAKALTAEMSGHVVVEAAAERIQDVQAALMGRDNRLTFSEAPQLAPGTARVIWRGGFDQIDASAAIKAGAALLDERLRAAGSQPSKTDGAPLPLANNAPPAAIENTQAPDARRAPNQTAAKPKKDNKS